MIKIEDCEYYNDFKHFKGSRNSKDYRYSETLENPEVLKILNISKSENSKDFRKSKNLKRSGYSEIREV